MTYAILSDVTPTRATVEFLGTEEEANDAGLHCDAWTECLIVPVRAGVTVAVGERVWIERAGERVLRVAAGA